MNGTQKDPIDEAIAATNAPSEIHEQTTVTISSTGRHVVISFPQDMTESELFEFVGWSANQLRVALAQRRAQQAGPQLIVARGKLPP